MSKIRKSNYKENLEKQRQSHQELIGNLSSSLANRVQRYYDSLNGKHAYVDNHTRKTVHARTYKKRLAFAAIELEGIEREVQLSRRYGVINDFDAGSLADYTRSLYDAAIKNNTYVKKTNGNKTKSAKKLRSNLTSIIEKTLDVAPKKMIVHTNYEKFDKGNKESFKEEVTRIYEESFELPPEEMGLVRISPPVYRQRDRILKCRRKRGIFGRMTNYVLGSAAVAIVAGLVLAVGVHYKRENDFRTEPTKQDYMEKIKLAYPTLDQEPKTEKKILNAEIENSLSRISEKSGDFSLDNKLNSGQ